MVIGMSKIAYAKHPLKPDDKKKLKADGYKILDVKFKPDEIGSDDIVFPAVKRSRKKSEE